MLRLLAGTCPPSAGSRVGVRPVAFVPPVVEPPPLPVRSWLRRCRDRRFPVSEALDVLELQGDVRAPLRSLSFGNFRKVLLADALSSTAPIVVIDEAREGLDDPGLLGLRELTRRAVRDGVAVVVADQDAHAVPVGTDMLTIDDGAVTIGRAARDQDEDVTVSLVGPSANAEDLLRRGAAVGFRPTDAP